jgi:hypothetical protein
MYHERLPKLYFGLGTFPPKRVYRNRNIQSATHPSRNLPTRRDRSGDPSSPIFRMNKERKNMCSPCENFRSGIINQMQVSNSRPKMSGKVLQKTVRSASMDLTERLVHHYCMYISVKTHIVISGFPKPDAELHRSLGHQS